MELKLIDCNLTGSLTELLMETLISSHTRLKTLALVNSSQTERSFAKILEFIEDSTYLRALDLSFTKLRTNHWANLFEELKDHSSLRWLDVSYNKLFDSQNEKPS